MSVVGIFRDDDSARAALHVLDAAGFSPDRVSVVAGNVRQAREAAGSWSLTGALVGGVIGISLAIGFILMAGPTLTANPVAVALGLVGFLIAGIAIGVLGGRGRVFKEAEYEMLENAVEHGNALVTIDCEGTECQRARSTLRSLGAVSVREEDTGESP